MPSTEIPKPRDWQVFERNCAVLFRSFWGDDHAQLYGREGQAQHGIDILAKRERDGAIVGVQCRHVERPLKADTIEDDCRRALAKHDLREIVFATTAPNDTHAADAAGAVEQRLRAEGHDIRVVLYGWDALQDLIHRLAIEGHTAPLFAFDPKEREVARLTEEARSLATALHIKEAMLVAVAKKHAPDNPADFDSALKGLEYTLEVEEAKRGRLPSNLPDAVKAIIAKVDALNDEGRIDEAQATLAAALVERQNAERLRLYDKAIAQARLANTPDIAAAYELKKIDLDAPADAEARYEAEYAAFNSWYETGRNKGRNFDLEVAIALIRHTAESAATPNHRGAALNDLGNALQILGDRKSDMARLEDAVAAYHAALEERTRERVLIDWASTQMNLGAALATLAKLESGTERLEEAYAAYRAVSKVIPREHPLWANTQNNVGVVLRMLGERESGTARLEEAIVAHLAALEEWTREQAPLHWATGKDNLGTTLQILGQRESGTARLEEAVRAYRAALQERTRECVPLDWATTQMNLGNALQTLGARESGTARLEEALTAYRAALEEWTRERVPLDWARTLNNLGIALNALGERESGTARLEEAVAAYRAALEEWTRERVPLDWAMTQSNLGAALQALGARESGTARLEEAVAAYRAALEERTRERVPLDWAMTQNNLGNALATLGERESGTARLEEAVAAYRAALEEWTRERVPLDWAMTQENLASAERALAGKTAGGAAAEHLSRALAAVDAALEVYDPEQSAFYFEKATQLRAEILTDLSAVETS